MYWGCCSCSHKMVDSPYTKWPPFNQLSAVQRCRVWVWFIIQHTEQHSKCKLTLNLHANKCCLSAVWNRKVNRQVLHIKWCHTLLYHVQVSTAFLRTALALFRWIYIIEQQLTWMCILITAFPMSVAPKKFHNGTWKCPQGIWNL